MTQPHDLAFGRLLRHYRIQAGMTHEELADKASVAVRTISDLERGVSLTPRRETVQGLAAALKLSDSARAGFEAAARGRQGIAADPAASRTLPRDLASFTGRESELQWLLTATAEAAPAGTVTIYAIAGMAGTGKTALTVHAAHVMAERFPDGQLFVDLRGYTDGLEPLSAEQALSLLLRSLGVPDQLIPEDAEERAAFYRSRLAGTRTLIILDNALDTAQVKPLLPGTAGCVVMVTSRRNLRGLDDARGLTLDVLPEGDAVTLFRLVAGPERVRADDPALTEIIGLCGQLPLAIRIVAARLAYRSALSTADLASQLRHEHGRLRPLQDEDRNVAAVFALSYRNLSAAEQHLFRHLGLIPGPDFDIYAAASVAAIDTDEAEQLLDSLIDHNLLAQRSQGRYRFHDLVRVYARTLSTGPGGAPAALGRLLDYYLYTAQVADQCFERRIPRAARFAEVAAPAGGPLLANSQDAQSWLAAELANLDAATTSAANHQQPALAVALCAALAQYLRAHGPWSLALAMQQRALDAARQAGDQRCEADALGCIGVTQRLTGAYAVAEVSLAGAADRYRACGDSRGQAAALVELAIVQRLTGAHGAAAESLRQALTAYRTDSDRHGQAGALAELGVVQRQTGAFGLAKESLSQALSFYRELGNRYGEAGTLTYLGSVEWSTGAFDEATDTLAGALELYRAMGDQPGEANSLLYLGGVQQEAGRHGDAATELTQALGIYRELGDRRGQAGCLAYLGVIQNIAQRYDQARESLTQALDLFRELRDRGGEAEVLNHYAALTAATGTPAEARARYSEALRLAREISSAKDEADALSGTAATYQAEQDTAAAAAHYRQALDRYQTLGCTADAARVQAALDDLAGDGHAGQRGS
jgi:tetratricopeptide (TPR) repeat protein/transcriptional regulator with XRE-family HTH domain